MSKSVTINGVTYSNCPAVEIPLSSGSGNATFTDTSDATISSTSQLPSGVTAYDANGSLVMGSSTERSSSDLTSSGATVTAPAGFYSSAASKSIASGSAKTPATTITVTPSISVSDDGTITAEVSDSQSVTPTVSAGYVSAGTAGTVSVTGSATEALTTKSATSYYPSSAEQTIASGQYLTGTQTIEPVVVTNLNASYIASGVTVQVGCADDLDSVTSVTGTYTSVTVSQDASTKILTIS